jgi:hypothetical protein
LFASTTDPPNFVSLSFNGEIVCNTTYVVTTPAPTTPPPTTSSTPTTPTGAKNNFLLLSFNTKLNPNVPEKALRDFNTLIIVLNDFY